MKQLRISDMMKNEVEKQKEDAAPENLVYSPISPNRAYRVVYTESDGDDQPGYDQPGDDTLDPSIFDPKSHDKYQYMDEKQKMAFEISLNIWEEFTKVMVGMDKQYQDKFNAIETELEALRVRDLQRESQLKDLRLKVSELLDKDKAQEAAITELSKIVEDDKQENLKEGATAGMVDSQAVTEVVDSQAVTAVADGTAVGDEGTEFSEVDKKNLKCMIVRYKQQERDYFQRSVRVSIVGLPKQTGSRGDAVKELLQEKGLEFLLERSESYYIYANSAMHITFKSYGDRNYQVLRARKILKNKGDKQVSLENLFAPEYLAKKRNLIQTGKKLKMAQKIVKYSIEDLDGVPTLRVVTSAFKVDWID